MDEKQLQNILHTTTRLDVSKTADTFNVPVNVVRKYTDHYHQQGWIEPTSPNGQGRYQLTAEGLEHIEQDLSFAVVDAQNQDIELISQHADAEYFESGEHDQCKRLILRGWIRQRRDIKRLSLNRFYTVTYLGKQHIV